MAKKRHVVFSKKTKKSTKAKAKKKKKLDTEDLFYVQQEKLRGQEAAGEKELKNVEKQILKLQQEADNTKENEAKEYKTPYEQLLAQLEMDNKGCLEQETAFSDDEMSISEDEEDEEEEEDGEEEEDEEEDEEADEKMAPSEEAEAEEKDEESGGEEEEDEEEEDEEEEEEKKEEHKDQEDGDEGAVTMNEENNHYLSFFLPMKEGAWTREAAAKDWSAGEVQGPSSIGEPLSRLEQYFGDKLLREKVKLKRRTDARSLALFHYFNSYRDTYVSDHTWKSNEQVRDMYTLHVANHVMKTRAKVPPEEGFARPKCLIICPYRSAAYDIINRIIDCYPKAKQIMNKARFQEEFGSTEKEEDPTDDFSHMMLGQNDDQFKIGMSFSNKTAKLFTQFYKSDIIVCSPLGLRLIVGSKDDRTRDFDFLSSLDMLILDRCDALRMQNWNHLLECIQVLNVQPSKMPETCDINNLRQSFLNKQGRLFRQTIATSNGAFADVQGLFVDRFDPKKRSQKRHRNDNELEEEDDMEVLEEMPEKIEPRRNFRGLVQLGAKSNGAPMRKGFAFGVQRQLFVIAQAQSAAEIPDAMFDTFEKKVWPTASGLDRLLIVVSGNMGYADFLRIRNFFEQEGVNYCSCHEYSSNKDLSRSRKDFFDGINRVLVVSERWWWFRRYRIKGAGQVLFYGVPETETLYSDALSWMKVPSRCNAMSIVEPRYEACALERIVGQQQVVPMMQAKANKMFSFTNTNM